MNYSKIAVRYAKAVFLLAEEKKQLKEVADDMDMLIKVEKEAPEILSLYNNPILSTTDKKKVITDLFAKSFNEISMSFLNLIIDNKREPHISGVARNYIKRYREHLGIKNAKSGDVKSN
jgi:F-type H+-transporting ATPase subunit delta